MSRYMYVICIVYVCNCVEMMMSNDDNDDDDVPIFNFSEIVALVQI